jgi:N6-L-threonylcarbamoyladenine synthase
MRFLAIETSCDETAVAVVSRKKGVETSFISSQVDLHRPFGGVVPEVACRAHQEWLPLLVKETLDQTGYSPTDFDGIAVTHGPGLIGALLVGMSFARGLAWAWDLPWAGINHLESHLASLDLADPPFEPPYVALLASGGHTEFFDVGEGWEIRFLGGTLDDAAGEAFDKVAHLLGLGYPGGPAIEKASNNHTGERYSFPAPMKGKQGCDISFSGLKTAVAVALQQDGSRNTSYWAASFQDCVVEALTRKLESAAKQSDRKRVALVGGVAANKTLRESINQMARRRGWDCGFSPLKYCGDNAAMVGAAALRTVPERGWSPLDLDVVPRLSLG